MADMKLTYFDMKGRAELVRLVFAAAGRKFEDVRYKQGEWDTQKHSEYIQFIWPKYYPVIFAWTWS